MKYTNNTVDSIRVQNTIKILLYQQDSTIYDIINFEDENIYKEPLLFAYLNNKEKIASELYNILFGYIDISIRPKQLEVKTDKYGRYYFPNLGWIHTDQLDKIIYLQYENKKLELNREKNNFYYDFEPIEFIKDTKIELLKYSIPLLECLYFNTEQNKVEVEIKNITRIHKHHITNALALIKEHIPHQFQLIEENCPKMVIFDVNTYLRNSFATLSAQGIGFLNAYQEEYNEVFFVDDIAHQTGHVLFNIIIYEVDNFISINPKTTIQSLKLYNNTTENRDVHTLFHALYTYYTSFMCINACIEAGIWHQHRLHEAMGRVAFYLGKCHQDLIIVENFNNKKPIFKEDGTKIYLLIKEKYKEMLKKYGDKCKNYSMANHTISPIPNF